MSFLQSLLYQEVVPTVGCTEPAAIALASAMARYIVGGKQISSIEVLLDINTYRNSIGVGIPNTNDTGSHLAAALGALIAKPQLELSILEKVKPEHVKLSWELIKQGKVKVSYKPGITKLYVDAKVCSRHSVGRAVIEDFHTHFTMTEKDGAKIYVGESPPPCSQENYYANNLMEMDLDDILHLPASLTLSNRQYMLKGYKMNLMAARSELSKKSTPGIGIFLNKLMKREILEDNFLYNSMFLTSSAVDARMRGENVRVMSCAGSGNQGIVSTLPVGLLCNYKNKNEEELTTALALSQLVTIYFRSFLGRLSSVCGVATAAAAGASVGITYLEGGDKYTIKKAAKNTMVANMGVICDGAKRGCATKALIGTFVGVISAYLTLEGIEMSDGIGCLPLKNFGPALHQISKSMESVSKIVLDLIDRNYPIQDKGEN